MGVPGLTQAIRCARDGHAPATPTSVTDAGARPAQVLVGTLRELADNFHLAPNPIVRIDALALLYSHAQSLDLSTILLPSYDWVDKFTTDVLTCLRQEGVDPWFYFDTSSASPVKARTIEQRFEDGISKQLIPMLDYLSGAAAAPPPPDKRQLPCMAVDQFIASLLNRNGDVIICDGEADAALVRCFDPSLDLAVVSQDSDFFCAGVRYIPLNELHGLAAPESGRVSGVLFTLEAVCGLLQLPPSLDVLHQLSTIVGNDYSGPVFQQYPALYEALGIPGVVAKAPMGMRRVFAVRDFLNSPGATAHFAVENSPTGPAVGAFRAALQKIRGKGPVALLKALDELTGAVVCSPPPPNSAYTYTTLCDAVISLRAPKFTLKVLYQHELSTGLPYELVNTRGAPPGVAALTATLDAAVCLLLGHTAPIQRRQRDGVQGVVVPFSPAAILKDYRVPPQFLATDPELVPLELRIELLWRPVLAAASPKAVGPRHPNVSQHMRSLVLPAMAVVHHTLAAHAANAPVPAAVTLALLVSSLLPSRASAPSSLTADARLVTVFSHFSRIYSSLDALSRLLGLPTVEPLHVLHGPIFQHLAIALLLVDQGQPPVVCALFQVAKQVGLRSHPEYLLQNSLGDVLLQLNGLDSVHDFSPELLSIFIETVRSVFVICEGCWLPSDQIASWAASHVAPFKPSMTIVLPHGFQEGVRALVAKAASATKSLPLTAALGGGAAVAAKPATIIPADMPTTAGPELPIMAFRQQILTHINAHPLTVIQADTGAGKSTRVPQMLYKVNPQCNIIVTQPRRMAATSLARRVADELGDTSGAVVGYRIGNDSAAAQNARITFVTSGWLLQRLISRPTYLQQVTHLILDEIHERSIDSDLLYVVIKRLLKQLVQQKKMPPKLILMSATFNTDVFGTYFNMTPKLQPPAAIYVGAHRFPVQIYHTNSMMECPLLQSMIELLPPPFSPMSLERSGIEFSKETQLKPKRIDTMIWLISALAQYHRQDLGPGIVVLVFLPGLAEIEKMFAALEDAEERHLRTLPPVAPLAATDIEPPRQRIFELIMLHSTLDGDDQERVFSVPVNGIARIVLSTNIAESSVTLPNVVYVIDVGLVKQVEYLPSFACDSLVAVSASKASAKQRAGRCGRVCPGTVFRMYDEGHFETGMKPYETPELLRVSLNSVLLRIKNSADLAVAHNPKEQPAIGGVVIESPFADPRRMLSECIDPPALDKIEAAFQDLLALDALHLAPEVTTPRPKSHQFDSSTEDDDGDSDDGNSDDGNSDDGGKLSSESLDVRLRAASITTTGRILAHMPIGLHHGKAIVIAARLGAQFVPAVLIAAVAMSDQQPFILPHPKFDDFCPMTARVTYGRMEADKGDLCDLVATIRVVKMATEVVHKLPPHKLRDFYEKRGIHSKRLDSLCHNIAELALRLRPLLPHCETVLTELHRLISGRRAARQASKPAKAEEESTDDGVEEQFTADIGGIDALLDLSPEGVAVVQGIIAAALWHNVCTVGFKMKGDKHLTDPVHRPTRQMDLVMNTAVATALADVVNFNTTLMTKSQAAQKPNAFVLLPEIYWLATELESVTIHRASAASKEFRTDLAFDIDGDCEDYIDDDDAYVHQILAPSSQPSDGPCSRVTLVFLQRNLASRQAFSVVTPSGALVGPPGPAFPMSLGELAFARCFQRPMGVATGGKILCVANPDYKRAGALPSAANLATVTVREPDHPSTKSHPNVALLRGGGNVIAEKTSAVPILAVYAHASATREVNGAANVHYGFSPVLMAMGSGKAFRADCFSMMPLGSAHKNWVTSVLLVLAAPRGCDEYGVVRGKVVTVNSSRRCLASQLLVAPLWLPAPIPEAHMPCIAFIREAMLLDDNLSAVGSRSMRGLDLGLLELLASGVPPASLLVLMKAHTARATSAAQAKTAASAKIADPAKIAAPAMAPRVPLTGAAAMLAPAKFDAGKAVAAVQQSSANKAAVAVVFGASAAPAALTAPSAAFIAPATKKSLGASGSKTAQGLPLTNQMAAQPIKQAGQKFSATLLAAQALPSPKVSVPAAAPPPPTVVLRGGKIRKEATGWEAFLLKGSKGKGSNGKGKGGGVGKTTATTAATTTTAATAVVKGAGAQAGPLRLAAAALLPMPPMPPIQFNFVQNASSTGLQQHNAAEPWLPTFGAHAAESTQPTSAKSAEWSCPACTFINVGSRGCCEMCSTTRK